MFAFFDLKLTLNSLCNIIMRCITFNVVCTMRIYCVLCSTSDRKGSLTSRSIYVFHIIHLGSWVVRLPGERNILKYYFFPCVRYTIQSYIIFPVMPAVYGIYNNQNVFYA